MDSWDQFGGMGGDAEVPSDDIEIRDEPREAEERAEDTTGDDDGPPSGSQPG